MLNSEHTLEKLNAMCEGTLMEHLSIIFTHIGEGFLSAQMPVSSRTYQPYKELHGGATLALAESVGSALSAIYTDLSSYHVKGMEINANHIRSVKSGYVTAQAKFLHRGEGSHIVEIRVQDEEGKLVSVCRLTNIILKR